MLNNISEKKNTITSKIDDIELQISEKDFFAAYDEINKDVAFDFIKKYLVFKQEDARPSDIDINYDKDKRVVTISTRLHYPENEYIIGLKK